MIEPFYATVDCMFSLRRQTGYTFAMASSSRVSVRLSQASVHYDNEPARLSGGRRSHQRIDPRYSLASEMRPAVRQSHELALMDPVCDEAAAAALVVCPKANAEVLKSLPPHFAACLLKRMADHDDACAPLRIRADRAETASLADHRRIGVLSAKLEHSEMEAHYAKQMYESVSTESRQRLDLEAEQIRETQRALREVEAARQKAHLELTKIVKPEHDRLEAYCRKNGHAR